MKFQEIHKLDANENVLGTSPKAIEAMKEAILSSNSYPDPLQSELKEKISLFNDVPTSQISICAGSSACLDLIVQGLTKEGDKILAFERSFIAYKELARVHDRKFEEVPMIDHEYSFYRLTSVLKRDVKLILLDNPNNPTGQFLKHSELEILMESLDPMTYVVLDEAYVEYVDDPDFPKTIDLFNKYPNLIVVRTFSKIYGLASVRCGYMFAREGVLKKIRLHKAPFSVNQFAIAGASAAIEDFGFIQNSLEVIREGRAYLQSELTDMGYKVLPSQGNFLYVYFNSDFEKEEFLDRLKTNAIKVCDLSIFDLDRSVRITVGNSNDNEALVNTLKGIGELV